jgi:hypothetical protein
MLFLFAASLLLPATPTFAGEGRGTPHVFRVIDKNGTLVGYTVTENMVAREIDGIWVSFYIHTSVGIFDSEAIYVHYVTSDCTGTPYVTRYSTFFEGTRVGPKLYYPTDQQILTPQSVRVLYGSGEQGTCYPAPNIPGVYGVAATVEVNSFGLELPFKAVQ